MKFFYVILLIVCSFFFLLKKTNLKDDGKLKGEWIVESAIESNYDILKIGNTYNFYGDSIRVFDNGYLYGTYEVIEDSILEIYINGYPKKTWVISKKANSFHFFDSESNVHYVLKPYDSFDFLVFILLFIIGLISIAVLMVVFENLYVWMVSVSWPSVKARVVEAKVNVSKHETYKKHAELTDYQFKTVKRGLFGFGDKIISKYYSPYVKFEFIYNNKKIVTDNSSSYNKRSGGYTENESNEWIAEWRKNGVPVRINPKDAKQVFFGWKHFPFVWTILLFFVFNLLSITFFVSLEMIFKLFNLEFVRINGTTSVLVFIIPVTFILYFILSIFLNFFQSKKVISQEKFE
ncbi:MAG: hypothetical protein HYU67_03155 [Flavobacteriia bacterium]|nr:hypothetical protein [Flavobacteriia bacterium]